MTDIECNTKPHFINDKPQYHIPSIYHDVSVDLSFISHMNCSLNIAVGKSPDTQREFLQTVAKKNFQYILLTEYINPFNYTSKHENAVKAIETYKKIDIINEYTDEQLVNELKILQEYKISISMDKLITTTNWEYWELYVKFPIVPLNKKVKAFFISKNLSNGGTELYIKYRELHGVDYMNDVYDVYEMGEDVMNPTGFKSTDQTMINKIKEVYPNINHNFVKPSICDLKKKYFEGVYDTIVSNVYYLDGKLSNYSETNNSYYLLFIANMVINNLNENGNLTVLVRVLENKLTQDLIFLIASCFDNSYICKESTKMHLVYKKLVCISKNKEKTNKMKPIITEVINKWVHNGIDNDVCQNKTTREDMLISAINADHDYYELINRYEKIIFNHHHMFQSLRDSFLESYIKNNDKLKFIREQQSKIIYSSIKWFNCYKIPISYEYETKEVIKNISANLLDSDISIRFDYSVKNIKKNNDYYVSTTLDTLYANYVMYQRMMDSFEDKELWFKLRAYVRHYLPLKQIASNITKWRVSQAFLKLYEILMSFDLFKNFDSVNSFHICEAPGQFIVATGHYMTSHVKNKKWNWYGQSLNHNSEANIKKYGSGIFADSYGLMKKFPNNWIFGPKNTGDITDIDNINYYAKNYNNINFITSDCGLTKENLDGYVHKEHSMSNLTLCEILFLLKILQKNGCFVIKVFMPIKSKINVSLLYILYQSFEKLCIYKPQMNPGSLEVYVVGEGYKICDNNTLNKIETLAQSDIKKIDNNEYIIPVPDEFIKMHIDMTETMLEGAKAHILRKMFLYQYPDFFEKNKINLEKLQNDICVEWTKKFKLTYEKNNPFI